MDDGVLSALLPRYVRRQYENDQARLEQEESQENKDPFEEGWLYLARGSNFSLIDDVNRLKPSKHAASVASLESDAYIIDLSDTTDAVLAQKRGEKCLKAIMDEMPKKPQKWGSGKSNLDGLVPANNGSTERMYNGEIVPENHPLYRMRHGSGAYTSDYFKASACRAVIRMPQCFVQQGSLTWMAVLSHLELWAQLEWHGRYGDDFCGQKTFNSADPALTTVPTKSDRTLAYLYTAEFYNVATCKAYKDGRPAPARTADSGHPASSSTSESSRLKKSSNPPSPARGGAQPAHSTLPAASTGGGGKAPTSQEVTTKEEAQAACVTKYKSVLTANPADCKAALDAAHEELHKYNGLDGLQAATKGPHIKVLVDAGLGTASSSESPGSVKTGAGSARAYFVPTWAPSKTKRKRVVEDDDSDK